MRRAVYVASAVAAVGLLAELAWWVLDPKGDARHGLDRLIRAMTR